MEALLIEAFEPPRNRRQGDRFREAEYIQEEDPQLKQEQIQDLLSEVQRRFR